jgi:hypothetical protein
MNYLDVDGYTLLIELTDEAETHALLDYISYLNNIFKEKELTIVASFITNDAFGIKDLKSKEESHDIVNILKHMELKDFNIPNIERFSIMHFYCKTEEVIENELFKRGSKCNIRM